MERDDEFAPLRDQSFVHVSASLASRHSSIVMDEEKLTFQSNIQQLNWLGKGDHSTLLVVGRTYSANGSR